MDAFRCCSSLEKNPLLFFEKSSSIRRGAEKLGAARLTFEVDGLDILGEGRNTGEGTSSSSSSSCNFLGFDDDCFDSPSSLKRSSRPSVIVEGEYDVFFRSARRERSAYRQNHHQISTRILLYDSYSHPHHQKDRLDRQPSLSISLSFVVCLIKLLFRHTLIFLVSRQPWVNDERKTRKKNGQTIILRHCHHYPSLSLSLSTTCDRCNSRYFSTSNIHKNHKKKFKPLYIAHIFIIIITP